MNLTVPNKSTAQGQQRDPAMCIPVAELEDPGRDGPRSKDKNTKNAPFPHFPVLHSDLVIDVSFSFFFFFLSNKNMLHKLRFPGTRERQNNSLWDASQSPGDTGARRVGGRHG